MNISKLIEFIVKVKPLESYRRKYGIAAIAVGALIHGLQAATAYLVGYDMVPGFLSTAAPVLESVGSYVALVGAAYKDESHLAGAKGR
jgi:ABC-type xylose transport system permease subunit